MDTEWQGQDRAAAEKKEKAIGAGGDILTKHRKQEGKKDGRKGRRGNNEILAFGDRHFTFSLRNYTAPVFTLVPPPPDLLEAPPGLVMAGWVETSQKKMTDYNMPEQLGLAAQRHGLMSTPKAWKGSPRVRRA